MKQKLNPNDGLIFMKVGIHDGEDFQEILERKRHEYKQEGFSFWGYGGGTCHPTKQVQPFSRMKIKEGANIMLVMEEINSNHGPTNLVAKEYSKDGQLWLPIPQGIEVRGSKYAIVLDELHEGDLDLDITDYQVDIGPSRGKVASEYVQGRVDKACISHRKTEIPVEKPMIKKITHIAKLKEPFAVFVR